jgi:hypothetical protein
LVPDVWREPKSLEIVGKLGRSRHETISIGVAKLMIPSFLNRCVNEPKSETLELKIVSDGISIQSVSLLAGHIICRVEFALSIIVS